MDTEREIDRTSIPLNASVSLVTALLVSDNKHVAGHQIQASTDDCDVYWFCLCA